MHGGGGAPEPRKLSLTAVSKITLAANVPRDRGNQRILREGLCEAVAYAWSIDERRRDRLAAADLVRMPRKVEHAAQKLLDVLSRASRGARGNIAREMVSARMRTVVGDRLDLTAYESVIEDLRDAASLAARRRHPTKQQFRYQTTFLHKVAQAIVDANGKRPKLDKNRPDSTWLSVVAALRDSLPAGFLPDSPASLASRVKLVRKALLSRAKSDKRVQALKDALDKESAGSG